jgi:hypothetical protein
MKKTLLIALCACLGAPHVAHAQYRAAAGVGFENFNFSAPEEVGVKRVSLLTVPLATRILLSNSLVLDLSGAWASGRMVRSDDSESEISGLTDTEVRLTLGLAEGQVVLTGLAQLPTGQDALSFEQADLAGVVAADVLPFRISNWGSGGGAGLSAALTRSMGAYAAGVMVGYVVAREYEPLDDAFAYRPGNQLGVRAAIDRTFAGSSKLSLVLSAQRYDTDQIEGANLFRAGHRYEAVGSYSFAVGSTGAGLLYAGYLHRNAGEYLEAPLSFPMQALLFVGGGIETRTGIGLLRPRAELRVLRRDDGIGQGYAVAAGADLEQRVGQVTLLPSLRGRYGNIVLRQEAESGFTGFEAGIGIRFGRAN